MPPVTTNTTITGGLQNILVQCLEANGSDQKCTSVEWVLPSNSSASKIKQIMYHTLHNTCPCGLKYTPTTLLKQL